MLRVPNVTSGVGENPHWYIFAGEYIYVCPCGHSTLIPFDRVKHSGEVEAGLTCHGCWKHTFICLEDLGGTHAQTKDS